MPARVQNLTLRTLRFYEDCGLLSPRRDGTARIYDARDRERLSVILKGKQLGLTLTEIRAMVAEERSGSGAAMNLKLSLDQIEGQIQHLEQQKKEIEEALARTPGPSRGSRSRRLSQGTLPKPTYRSAHPAAGDMSPAAG
jgi:DNA-binding transcriptional MerR regulator